MGNRESPARRAHRSSITGAALEAGVASIEHGTYTGPRAIRLFKETGAYLVHLGVIVTFAAIAASALLRGRQRGAARAAVRIAVEMAEEGLIGLTMRKGSNNAAFFSANSAQKPKYFGATKEGKAAETNYKLATQLPYMFIVSRLAHYIKVLQREQIGVLKAFGYGHCASGGHYLHFVTLIVASWYAGTQSLSVPGLIGLALTAAAVTTAGAVGFVGLVTPHLVRRLGGTDHRVLLPASVLLGGSLLLVPAASVESGQVAILADPTGAVFGIQQPLVSGRVMP